jgi:DNA mismatch endonuclease (patch repair protein)
VPDIFEPEKRSFIMSRIRGKNTKVERLVFAYLRKEGVYFQKHYRTKQGIVLDIALPRKKKAVFIDGDFWHGRTVDKVRARRGKDDFWTKKIERNIERDEEQAQILIDNGWKFTRAWESDLVRKRTNQPVLERIAEFLKA